ncbi:ABC transporter ATP-binding protein [Flavobacteriaceae bacterium]|nr:ABC transporter ATP-binding protein [Flavobacteriaceae bacterium]
MDNNEVLVKVEGLSKKFCKDLKTSLWYGVKDLLASVTGRHNDGLLRPKEFWAVKDINFELRRGECLGLIGHNGAGKSTLLKILNGLINPDEGKVTIKGKVGALIELGAGFNAILSGRENIYNNGAVLGFTRAEIDAKVEEIIDFAELREFIDMPVRNYSSGMKVRLGFAVAAQMEPDVLLIDEVLAVGDLGFRVKCMNRINDLLKNTAIVFVSHGMNQITTVCTSILLMNKGETEYYGDNVGLGVEKYFLKFGNGEQQIISDGSIELSRVELQNISMDSNHTVYINSGENLELLFELESNIEYKKLHFRLGIFNIEYKLLAEVDSNQQNFIASSNNGKLCVKVILKNIYLKYGKYNIHLHVTDVENNKKILRHSSIACFMVKPTLSIGADFLLPSEWIEIIDIK